MHISGKFCPGISTQVGKEDPEGMVIQSTQRLLKVPPDFRRGLLDGKQVDKLLGLVLGITSQLWALFFRLVHCKPPI